MKKLSYEEITKAASDRIERLALCANKSSGSEETRQHHRRIMGEWAYGVYLMWEQLTGGLLSAVWEADSERLREMANVIGRKPGDIAPPPPYAVVSPVCIDGEDDELPF